MEGGKVQESSAACLWSGYYFLFQVPLRLNPYSFDFWFFFPTLDHSGVWCIVSPKRERKKKKEREMRVETCWSRESFPNREIQYEHHVHLSIRVCVCVCVCLCLCQRLGQMWWTDVRLTGHRCSVKINMSRNVHRGSVLSCCGPHMFV